MAIDGEVRKHMGAIGAGGVHTGTVDGVNGERVRVSFVPGLAQQVRETGGTPA